MVGILVEVDSCAEEKTRHREQEGKRLRRTRVDAKAAVRRDVQMRSGTSDLPRAGTWGGTSLLCFTTEIPPWPGHDSSGTSWRLQMDADQERAESTEE